MEIKFYERGSRMRDSIDLEQPILIRGRKRNTTNVISLDIDDLSDEYTLGRKVYVQTLGAMSLKRITNIILNEGFGCWEVHLEAC